MAKHSQYKMTIEFGSALIFLPGHTPPWLRERVVQFARTLVDVERDTLVRVTFRWYQHMFECGFANYEKKIFRFQGVDFGRGILYLKHIRTENPPGLMDKDEQERAQNRMLQLLVDDVSNIEVLSDEKIVKAFERHSPKDSGVVG